MSRYGVKTVSRYLDMVVHLTRANYSSRLLLNPYYNTRHATPPQRRQHPGLRTTFSDAASTCFPFVHLNTCLKSVDPTGAGVHYFTLFPHYKLHRGLPAEAQIHLL